MWHFPSSRNLRGEEVGHKGISKVGESREWTPKRLMQTGVGEHRFSVGLPFLKPVLSPLVSPRSSSCLVLPLLSDFLCFTSPLPLGSVWPLFLLSCHPFHSSCLPFCLSESLFAFLRNACCGMWKLDVGVPRALWNDMTTPSSFCKYVIALVALHCQWQVSGGKNVRISTLTLP